MKNRIIIILIATIINISLFAQNKNDSIRIFKNEIGWNIIPTFNLGNVTNEYKPIFNVFYKREIKNNWHGRASFIYYNNGDNEQIHLEKIKGLANSKFSIDYSQTYFNNYFQYNLGFEKRFGKRKKNMFTGLDIGYAHKKTEKLKYFVVRDSIINTWLGNYPSNENLYGIDSDSTIFHNEITSNSIILTPFYGVRYNIGKHFLISAQFGVSLSFEKATNKTIIDNQLNKNYVGARSSFDFDLGKASSNISLCYRF